MRLEKELSKNECEDGQKNRAHKGKLNFATYDLAVEIFREESSRGHIDLQETLVDRIAERLSNLPGVELIRISSEKTEAYDDADAIGVEVWRSGSPLLT